MLTVNVHEAKTKFSYFLNLVKKGKRVVVSKRNVPIAQIIPFEKNTAKREIGQCLEKFDIPESFFKPLPKSLINSFSNPK